MIALNLSQLEINDDALTAIVQNCLSIVHLDLQHCSNITDTGVYTVATTLKLKSIALPCDLKVTNLSLVHLSHSASTLQALHVSQSFGHGAGKKLTYPAVEALLRKSCNCKYTWSTYTSDCARNWRDCTHSTHIIADTNVSDELLFQIAKSCKHLVYLDIAVDTDIAADITSAGLFAVIHNCPALQTIFVNRKLDKAHYADVLTMHSKLFTCTEVPVYDVMELV